MMQHETSVHVQMIIIMMNISCFLYRVKSLSLNFIIFNKAKVNAKWTETEFIKAHDWLRAKEELIQSFALNTNNV